MAKRRRVDIPTAESLAELEAGFEVKSNGPRPAPIAQIAAEAAALAQPIASEDRAQQARDTVDAEQFRQAQADGRLAINLPMRDIQTDELTRDRAVLDAEAMVELKASISAHGLRQAVEVFALEDGGYGLVSGYRRVMVMRDLYGADASIPAIVRTPVDAGDAYIAMVEENEIRANLSHYERGRIAVMAAGRGAFSDIHAAVDALFATGSKAKRSKIRSFAMIHEELGDVLRFAHALSERAGLSISNALKAGQGAALRDALANSAPESPGAEWSVIQSAMRIATPAKVSRAKPVRDLGAPIRLANGITMTRERDRHGYAIRLDGEQVDEEFLATLMSTVETLLKMD